MSRNLDGKQEPIIMHWYDLVEHLSNKGIRNTAVFLHGLGNDLTNKFNENSENKEESILNHLQNQKVIRIVFDGHEKWDFDCSSDEHLCVSFQQAVRLFVFVHYGGNHLSDCCAGGELPQSGQHRKTKTYLYFRILSCIPLSTHLPDVGLQVAVFCRFVC
jgi:hypothetical protein